MYGPHLTTQILNNGGVMYLYVKKKPIAYCRPYSAGWCMRPPAMCVRVHGTCEPHQTAYGPVNTAQNLNDGGVFYAQLKRTRPPTAVIKAHADAYGRLRCAFGSRACVDPTRPLMPASVPPRSTMMGGLPHTLHKRTRQPTAVIQALAGACGRLPCAVGSRSHSDHNLQLMAASVPPRSVPVIVSAFRFGYSISVSFYSGTSAGHLSPYAYLSGVGENQSLKDVSAPGTRIQPGYRVRREACNVLRFDGE